MPGQIRLGMKYCSIWVEIHGFTPNLSSISGLVKLGIIPMNSTGIYLNGFTPNSTGRIRPGMKYCSIWVEIHGFTPNLSSISGLVKLGIIPMNSTGIYLNGFTPNSTSRIRPGMKYCSKWV